MLNIFHEMLQRNFLTIIRSKIIHGYLQGKKENQPLYNHIMLNHLSIPWNYQA